MADLLDRLRAIAELARMHESTEPRPLEIVVEEVLGPAEVVLDGRRTLMFGSNNYFGLTAEPRVLTAARAALERFGSATTGSRIANGTLVLHRRLEHALAEAFGKRTAAVFTTGYQGNLAVVGALCGPGDFVVLDADCHASLYDAARLSGATIVGSRHNDVAFLARQLGRLPAGGRNRLVVVEGLYSIQGDLAPLAAIVEACRDHGAYLLVDEAHSFGPFGARGLGCAEAQGVLAEVDFVVGTFSKTLAGVGGFVVSDHEELEALHMLARPYLFTASGSPANIAGVLEALAIATSERGLAERLWHAVGRLRTGLAVLGYRIGPVASPIVAVTIGELGTTRALWRALLAQGLYVNLVAPPACRPDACLLRMSCGSCHTDAHVDQALDILGRVGRELGLLPVSP
jgi:8-amino-7-oxononanoate synthase